jgi:hypothetical protein
MTPFPINPHLIQDLEHYAASSIEDDLLLTKVRAQYPKASLTEIRRAALYITTDPFPANAAAAVRMSQFVKSLRQ